MSAESERVYDAVRDLLWRATQYGETEDGDTAFYLLTKGTVHRLVGAMVSAGQSAPLRTGGTTSDGLPGWLTAVDIRQELLDMVPTAVGTINRSRRLWIDNGFIQEDGPVNEALGAVCVAAGWAANGAVTLPVSGVSGERTKP
jgi:hypothetical protein